MRRLASGVLTIVGALLVVASITATPLSAQTGKLTGVVTDQSTGQPLAGVQVYLEGTGRGALTQENGRYFVINVPAGTYTVVAELIGYATVRRENVTINIDVTRQLNFEMPQEAVALGEVVVEAERTPLVPEGQTGSVDMISKDEIDALPVTDIIGVLELEQGFLQVPQDNTTVVSYAQQRQGVTSLRIRGGRGAQTMVMIDGIPINNFVLGGPAFDITNKAIEQVAVFKGQMDAQYGNALSGVINYATPEGSRELEGEIEFRSSATGAWLGNDYDDTRDFDMFEGFLSGPIPGTSENVRFFVAGRQQYGADRAFEFDDDVFDPSNPSSEFNTPDPMDLIPGWRATGYDEERDIYAKATWYATPAAKLNVSFVGYERERKPFDFDWMLAINPLDHVDTPEDSAYYLSGSWLEYADLKQNSLRQERNMLIAKWDHTIGRTAYKITAARLDQQRVTCTFYSGACLTNHFEDPNFSGGFVAPGPQPYSLSPTTGTDYFWGGEDLTTYTARADVQSQVSDHHNISAGAFFQYHDLLYDEWQNVGVNDVVVTQELYEANPWDGALYVQDQIEYDFLTLKLGARFDYGKATGLFFANPVDPTNGTTALDVCQNPGEWQGVELQEVFDRETGDGVLAGEFDPGAHGVRTVTVSADPSWTLQSCADPATRAQAARVAASDDFEEADARTQFSPRVGVNFPVTESATLFFNFGRYSQNPILRNNYKDTGIGTATEGTTFGPKIFTAASAGTTPFLGNPHLLTEEATTYEVGYSQTLSEEYALQANIYSKDQSGLTGVTSVGDPPFVVNDPGGTYGTSSPSYTILTNQDFQTTRGFEVSLRRRLQNYWGFDLNYGYSKCTSNAADPEREFEAITEEGDPSIRDEITCEIDRPHTFNGVLRLGVRDDTPDIPFGEFLRNTNLSVIVRSVSGLPYTPTSSFGGFNALSEFERYSARGPSQFSIDLQARKDWTVGNVRYGFFLNVTNLTDRLNCVQVYATTGECIGGAEDQNRRRAGNSVNPDTDSTFFDRPQFIGARRSITAGLRVTF